MIDVHAHAMPAAYRECLDRLGALPATMPPPSSAAIGRYLPLAPATDRPEDLAERIALMDDAGVTIQILSPTFAPYFDDAAQAVEAARTVNDALAAMVAYAPDRLAAFASLPLPHVDAALAEMARCLDELGMAGVTLQCFCKDRSIADPLFEPLYAEMQRRGAVLFLHPCMNGLCSRFLTDWSLASAAGPTIEDSVVAMHLMVSGIPSRYPDVRIIIPHLGGGLATLVKRLDNQLPLFAALHELPSVTVRRMWYDICCHGSAAAMHCAIEAFGADRLLPGSDYPFLTVHEPHAENFSFLAEIGLSPDDLDAIVNRNAAALFPRLGAPARDD